MVFDQHGNGVPVAWILTGAKGERKEYMLLWMDSLKDCMVSASPSWAPASFIVDDCDAEIGAIRC